MARLGAMQMLHAEVSLLLARHADEAHLLAGPIPEAQHSAGGDLSKCLHQAVGFVWLYAAQLSCKVTEGTAGCSLAMAVAMAACCRALVF